MNEAMIEAEIDRMMRARPTPPMNCNCLGCMMRSLDERKMSDAAVEPLRQLVSMQPVEHIAVAFFRGAPKPIATEMLGSGTATRTQLNIHQLFKRAYALEATHMVLAHNHPPYEGFESTLPSNEDISTTLLVGDVGQRLNIRQADHLVFTHRYVRSMRFGWSTQSDKETRDQSIKMIHAQLAKGFDSQSEHR